MANYTFTSDLLADVLFRAGEPTDGTSDFAGAALAYLNRGYQAIWMGGTEIAPQVHELWWWLFKEANVIMDAAINTGTVSVTNGSATATLSTAPAASVAGFWFKVSGDATAETYKISAHTGGSATLTLDSIYLGATNATANYILFKTDFALATDVLRLATPMRVGVSNSAGTAYSRSGRNYQVLGLSNRELDEVAPLGNIASGVPSLFAQVGEATVRFNKYNLSGRQRIDYTYLQRPADLTSPGTSEEPVLPRQYRRLIADVATFLLFVDKNDSRAEGIGLMARQGITGMAHENQIRLQILGERYRELAPKAVLKLPGRENDVTTPLISNQYLPTAGAAAGG